jgi:hypothetical protein
VQAHHHVHAVPRQQRDLGVRAEAAVGDQHVAAAQQRVQRQHLTRLVAEQWAAHRHQDAAADRVDHAQQLAHRKAQPRALARRVAEVPAQRRGVGHREAGRVGEQHATPIQQRRPGAITAAAARARRLRDRVEQPREQRQRQPHPRGAEAGGLHRDPAGVAQRADGEVAVEDLQHEQPDGDRRRELAAAPGMSQLIRQCINVDGQQRDLTLDVIDRRAKMASHPWPPVGERCRRATPFSQEAIDRASNANARGGAELRVKRMAFWTVPH